MKPHKAPEPTPKDGTSAAEVKQSDGAPALSCVLYGGQPRFLFVHGSSASAATWAPVMTALAALGEASIAADLRGHGKSSGRERLQSWRIQHYVEDVISVLKEFPSIRTLVGHSMGGLLCQFVASRVRIGNLILVASSPVGGMFMDGLRMFARHPATILAACFSRSFARLYKLPSVVKSLLFHPSTPNSVVEASLAKMQEESWWGGNQLIWLLAKPRNVTCPVSVIGGTHDAMVSPASVLATARAYGVSPIFVEGTAHMVPIEAEPRAFAKLLLQCAEKMPGVEHRTTQPHEDGVKNYRYQDNPLTWDPRCRAWRWRLPDELCLAAMSAKRRTRSGAPLESSGLPGRPVQQRPHVAAALGANAGQLPIQAGQADIE